MNHLPIEEAVAKADIIDGRTLFTDWTKINGGLMQGGYGFLSPSARREIEYYASRVTHERQRAAALEQAVAALLEIVEAELEADPEPDDLTSWKRAVEQAYAVLKETAGRGVQ